MGKKNRSSKSELAFKSYRSQYRSSSIDDLEYFFSSSPMSFCVYSTSQEESILLIKRNVQENSDDKEMSPYVP